MCRNRASGNSSSRVSTRHVVHHPRARHEKAEPLPGDPSGEKKMMRREAIVVVGKRVTGILGQEVVEEGRSGPPVTQNKNRRSHELRLFDLATVGPSLQPSLKRVCDGLQATRMLT